MASLQQRLRQLMGIGTLALLSTLSWKAVGAVQMPGVAVVKPSVTFLQAIALGMVQGLTEFLPISSTGHLIVVSDLLGWGTPSIALTAILELGSVAAVLWYFWRDVVEILLGAFKALQTNDYQSQQFHLAAGIGLGTLPIVVFGVLLKKLVPDLEHSPLRSLTAIAIASILMALLLGLAEKLSQHQRNFGSLRVPDGLWMGLAQAMAILPGVSRSGATLTAGLFMGLERATAARFSFLLAIPAITLAGLVEVVEMLESGVGTQELLPMLVGGIASAIFSYGAIAWLLNYLQTRTTWIFVWYRLAFGTVILAAIASGLLKQA
jgi:undecaprenyl-diphosphatase